MTYSYISKKRKERSIIIPIDENKKNWNWNIKHLRLPFLLQGWQWYPSEGEES